MALDPTVRRWLSRSVTALSFVIGAWVFWRLWEDFGPSFRSLSLTTVDLAIVFLLSIPAYLVIIFRSLVLLRTLGLAAPLGAITAINVASQAIGNLLPGGAITELGFRTFYFVRSGLPADSAILVNTVDGFIRFATNSLLLFFVAMYFLLVNFVDDTARVTVLLGLALSLLGIAILAAALIGGLDTWFLKTAHRLGQVGETHTLADVGKLRFIDFLRSHKKAVLWASALSAIGFFLEPLQLWVLLSIAGIPLPLWAVFWLAQALALPRVLPVPGAVGVAEESGIQFARLIGEVESLGFVASILWRVRLAPYIVIGLLLVPFLAFFRLAPSDKMKTI